MNISVVVRGSIDEDTDTVRETQNKEHDEFYKGAISKGIFLDLQSDLKLFILLMFSGILFL